MAPYSPYTWFLRSLLVDAGRLLDVPVYDHVIVAGDRYFSFAEAGLL